MSEKTYELAGIRLTTELIGLKPDGLPQYLARNADMLVHSERPFADYMRMKFREKGMQQQDIFLAADLSERYGYKLISEEKHTTSRDTILRICLAARFDEIETDEALTLYGMAPLHVRNPRDVAFIVAINNRIFDIHDVDAILRENDLPPFLT